MDQSIVLCTNTLYFILQLTNFKGYKLWNDPVECTPLKTKAFLMRAQTSEILCKLQEKKIRWDMW